MRRGEIWWGETPQEKGRPYLVVSRDSAIGAVQRILVVPVTTRVRRVPSSLLLGPDEGLHTECVASFDNIQPFLASLLTRRVGALDTGRLHEICDAMGAAIDC